MSTASKPVRPLSEFLRVLIAPAIWFGHFSFLYAAEALICIGAPADRLITMGSAVFLATAVAFTSLVILVAGLLRPGKPSPPAFDERNSWLLRASLMITLLSALAILWTTLPTTILPACAPG